MKEAINQLISPLRRISIPKPNASVLLFLAALVAVAVANSSWGHIYQSILDYPFEVKILGVELFAHHGQTMTVAQFVNDALMAIFFFVVGLEIKQEMTVGELSTVKKSILPVIAAFGGMIVPVLAFYLVCPPGPAMRGAAIPMATDIAFALALLGALGKHVPSSYRVFLMALAVADDIGGIIIIAIFYSSHVAWVPLLLAFGLLMLVAFIGKLGMRNLWFYMLAFAFVWYLFLESGVHTTIAGVLLALCVPLTTKIRPEDLRAQMRQDFQHFDPSDFKEGKGALVLSHHQLEFTETLRKTLGRTISPVQQLEHAIAPFVSYFILPIFAFVNAGVSFEGISADGLFGLPLAIFCGLFLGKTIGISLFTWIAIRLKISPWPSQMSLLTLIPLAKFGGIGFTVSLFIASLSYGAGHEELLNQAKLGIFAGTIISAVAGYLWLGFALKRTGKWNKPEQKCLEQAH